MLIVLEGSDGVGKTTVAKALAEKLGCSQQCFPSAHVADYQMIRAYLRRGWSVRFDSTLLGCKWEDSNILSTDLDRRESAWSALYQKNFGVESDKMAGAMCFQALMTCNKYAQAAQLREFIGHKEKHIVLDRYWHSAYVYGLLDGLPGTWLLDIHSRLPVADVAILLDADEEVAVARQGDRGGQKERYEGDVDRAGAIRQLYLDLWSGDIVRVGGYCLTVNSSSSVQDIVTYTASQIVGAV